ncbi:MULTISPECIES: TonB-dependent receptor [unclassified Beijerinckia]|uniref:TonB-dependent receptor n=1 Tax=unclassified Beijerinckia TaxID=2638183 RepID=UPI000898BC34|nr:MULTISPECIES: TonB-dependent receptor [unclassified Beijerinckia]MDH7794498.1 iron complex outermembrane receptor protein [Beijerinckia sp. GAS462]SEB64420.1 iron complex outermembrane recepter protein [Beijerinckia sp. 28-YEA-48]
MFLRHLTITLLAGTSLIATAVAQTAPNETANARAARNARAAAQQSAPPVQPHEAAQRRRDGAAQSGLTAAPTDFGRIDIREGGDGATPGGVTRQDIGGGYMIQEETPKTRSTVTRDAIDKLSPTANPYQMIEMLPGANVSSPDAAGLNGGNITIRGFNSDQIGMTVEGAPVNDSGSYALYPQEYVDGENISQVSLAQGAPDIDSPHIGSTGGVINVYMRDPSKTYGGLVKTTLGSYNKRRIFGRIETGDMNGLRGYVSFSRYHADHWAQPGQDDRTHIDTKWVYDISAGNRISASLIYNQAINNNYINPTLAQFHTLGFSPAYAGSLPSTFITGPDQSAGSAFNYYKMRINPFRNLIASAPSVFTITDKLTFDTVPYFWYGYGNGGGTSTLTENPIGTVSGPGTFWGNQRITGVDWFPNGIISSTNKGLLFNPSITETYRPGIINKLTYQLDDHKIIFGHWFERATHKQTAPYAYLTAAGEPVDPYGSGGIVVPAGQPGAGSLIQRRDTMTTTMSNTFFLGDTWSLFNDRLSIEYGLKQTFINRRVENFLPGATPVVTRNDTATLPQIGVRYRLTDEHSVFASINTTFRTTPNFALADAFSNTTGLKTTAANNTQSPEKAITFEVGHRYQGELINTSLSFFATQYRNRQVTTNTVDPSGGTALLTQSINAGRVNSYGVDFEIGTRPIYNFRPYLSAEYLRTRLMDNLPVTLAGGAQDYLPVAGKELPRAPRYQLGLGLDYDDGKFFANVRYKFYARQYSTFTNDQQIGPYGLMHAGFGYRFDDFLGVKKPEIKVNLYNLFDRRTLVGVNGVQTNALATRGVNGGIISGSAPTYYQGQGFAASLTMQVAF